MFIRFRTYEGFQYGAEVSYTLYQAIQTKRGKIFKNLLAY